MNDAYEEMRRIRDRDQAMNVQGFNTNPWQTHQLANGKPGAGVPVAGARVPQVLTIEQDADGKWIGNGGQYGPFDSIRDLELAVYGRSDLSAGKRDWRDDARPADE
jgi:hypothetical protein